MVKSGNTYHTRKEKSLKMNSTEVQNPRRKLDVFGSVLACAKSAHMFQKLSYSLWRLCLSLLSLITLPQTERFIVFSGSPTAVHFPFLQYKGMSTVTNWPLHVHYGITPWAYFSQMHRPNLSIALWAYLPEPLVKDSHKCLIKCDRKIPQYCVLQVTWSHIHRCVRVTERYTETLHMQKMADLVVDSQ